MDHIGTLTNINGKNVYIDNNIRPLIIALNELGLTTRCCCENLNNMGKVQILFDDSVTDDQIKELIKSHKKLYRGIDSKKEVSIRKILYEDGLSMCWAMYIDLDYYQEVEDEILFELNRLFLRSYTAELITKDTAYKDSPNIYLFEYIKRPLELVYDIRIRLSRLCPKDCSDYKMVININSMYFIWDEEDIIHIYNSKEYIEYQKKLYKEKK